jgi:hypothetical protein
MNSTRQSPCGWSNLSQLSRAQNRSASVDEQSYIDYLSSHGVQTWNRPAALGEGYRICAQIREGMSPDDAINQYMGINRLWTTATVFAAQHELCPNTLPPS